MKSLENLDKKTILLVDDEGDVAYFLGKLLINEGYDVINASDGRREVEIYLTSNKTIDMVLMDINMPVMDGIEAYRELRRIDSDALIMLMSAYSRESIKDIENLYFIRKPMNPAELFDKIHECLSDA